MTGHYRPGFRRLGHILVLALKGFSSSECQLRAGALTYYTLFSLVPAAALLFGLARGFKLDVLLREHLMERLQEHEAVLRKIFDFADSALRTASGGVVAGVGVLLLLWTVLKLLASIEGSFNGVWHLAGKRSFFRRVGEYIALLMVAPIALAAIISAGVMVNTSMIRVIAEMPVVGCIGAPLVRGIMDALPIVLSWGLLSFIYIFVPHTRVRWTSGVLGGVVAGTLYQLLQSGYLVLQVGLANYNVIYGSFSALPLFMIYVQLSWLVVLFGTELSYVDQNYDRIVEADTETLCSEYTEKLQLFLLHGAVRAFDRGFPPPGLEDFERESGLTPGQVEKLVDGLLRSGLLRECSVGNRPCFLPGLPTDRLTVTEALKRLRGGAAHRDEPLKSDFRHIADVYGALQLVTAQSSENRLLREL